MYYLSVRTNEFKGVFAYKTAAEKKELEDKYGMGDCRVFTENEKELALEYAEVKEISNKVNPHQEKKSFLELLDLYRNNNIDRVQVVFVNGATTTIVLNTHYIFHNKLKFSEDSPYAFLNNWHILEINEPLDTYLQSMRKKLQYEFPNLNLKDVILSEEQNTPFYYEVEKTSIEEYEDFIFIKESFDLQVKRERYDEIVFNHIKKTNENYFQTFYKNQIFKIIPLPYFADKIYDVELIDAINNI